MFTSTRLLVFLAAVGGHVSAFYPGQLAATASTRLLRTASNRAARPVLGLSARFVGEQSQLHAEVLSANEKYASKFGAKADLALPPGRQAAFIVCMDARIDPCAALGLAEGDAHVIRNAGGRASDDAIRSLVISHKLLGTKEWFVIHHTDCGMEYFKSSQLAELLKTSLSTANIVPDEAAPKGVKFENVLSEGGASTDIDFLHIDNQDESVKEDVAKIAQHPLVASGIPVHGYMYDCKTGKINHIVSAVTRE